MIETLKQLCRQSGISGFEGPVGASIVELCRDAGCEAAEYENGNLLLFKKGAVSPKRPIMLCAHMDEVGVMIRGSEENGFLRFGFVGGIDRRTVLGKQVFLGPERIPGIIGCKPVHLCTEEEEEKVPPVRELYIDIGAASAEEADALVPPGTTGVFTDDIQPMANGFLKAKALDDRIGCAVMVALLHEELPVDTFFAFTVQEEVGCRGAYTAAFGLMPEYALVLEGTTAADIPLSPKEKRVCECGKGPTISYMDGASIANREFFQLLTEAADANQIPWQYKTRVAGGNDAGAIQRTGTGCRTCVVSVPVRYIHSAATVCCLWDVVNAKNIARKFLQEMGNRNA